MQFLVVLVVAALWVKYFWVFAAGVAVIWLGHRLVKAWRGHQDGAATEARCIDDVRARADQQHDWVMQGDPRGTFGEYPAAPM
jgi:nitrate/nitrite transporter NarK